MKTKLGTHTSRQIETRMVDAVVDMRNWREVNTEVKVDTNQANGMPVARVYLFGHHIANMQQVRHDTLNLQAMTATLAVWPTRTTVSRLRTLGASIQTIKGVLYLNGVAVS